MESSELRSVDELRHSYNQDGVVTEEMNELAGYRKFRLIIKESPTQYWEINFNVGNFFTFVRRIAESAGV